MLSGSVTHRPGVGLRLGGLLCYDVVCFALCSCFGILLMSADVQALTRGSLPQRVPTLSEMVQHIDTWEGQPLGAFGGSGRASPRGRRIFTCVRVCICVCIHVYMYELHLHICVRTHVQTHLLMNTHMTMSVSMSVPVSTSMLVCAQIHVYVHAPATVDVCAQMAFPTAFGRLRATGRLGASPVGC